MAVTSSAIGRKFSGWIACLSEGRRRSNPVVFRPALWLVNLLRTLCLTCDRHPRPTARSLLALRTPQDQTWQGTSTRPFLQQATSCLSSVLRFGGDALPPKINFPEILPKLVRITATQDGHEQPGTPVKWQSISRNADCFPWVMRALCDQRHRSVPTANIGWRPALVPQDCSRRRRPLFTGPRNCGNRKRRWDLFLQDVRRVSFDRARQFVKSVHTFRHARVVISPMTASPSSIVTAQGPGISFHACTQ